MNFTRPSRGVRTERSGVRLKTEGFAQANPNLERSGRAKKITHPKGAPTRQGTAKRGLAKQLRRPKGATTTLITTSSTETISFAERLGKNIKPGLICLYGDLGAGKTTFVRGLAKGLGVKSRVQSPTFTYQRIHRGLKTLFHFDCYRMNGEDSLLLHEIEEALKQKNAVVIIEWSEKIVKFLPKNRLDIKINSINETTRMLKIYNSLI